MSAVPFDRSVLKVTQALLISCLVIAYLAALATRWAELALPVLALMMLGAVASTELNLPRRLYLTQLRPRGWVRPRVAVEDPAPHRFAQLVGGLFLVGASVAALAGSALLAWTLAWIVVALALLNFLLDVCVGCIVYAQLVRLGVLGRRRSPA